MQASRLRPARDSSWLGGDGPRTARGRQAGAEEAAKVPSVWDLYNIANWMEREVYDMFGIAFTGHPNLRRIMCHDEFVGHALRKDYPINKRQKLSQPSENILCEKVEYA